MLSKTSCSTVRALLLVGALTQLSEPMLPAQSARPSETKPAGTPYRYQPNRFAGRAGLFYNLVWGIDSPTVKWSESGELIRFSYRVLDPEKAKLLHDKKLEPALIDEEAQVRLVIPSLEKVGLLRQSGAPEAGKSYWMAFSNKGGLVKPGHRVTVVIGTFRATGLAVE